MSDMKQIIVMRADLNYGSKGKFGAQVAHASLAGVLKHLGHPKVEFWLEGAFTKIVVRVESEEDLRKVAEAAGKSGLLVGPIITDSGRTVFKEPTATGVTIGPDTDEKLKPVTGHLRLY